jgi:hypothetical protein
MTREREIERLFLDPIDQASPDVVLSHFGPGDHVIGWRAKGSLANGGPLRLLASQSFTYDHTSISYIIYRTFLLINCTNRMQTEAPHSIYQVNLIMTTLTKGRVHWV